MPRRAQADQCRKLGVAAEDRPRHHAGDHVAMDDQLVARCSSKPSAAATPAVKAVNPSDISAV